MSTCLPAESSLDLFMWPMIFCKAFHDGNPCPLPWCWQEGRAEAEHPWLKQGQVFEVPSLVEETRRGGIADLYCCCRLWLDRSCFQDFKLPCSSTWCLPSLAGCFNLPQLARNREGAHNYECLGWNIIACVYLYIYKCESIKTFTYVNVNDFRSSLTSALLLPLTHTWQTTLTILLFARLAGYVIIMQAEFRQLWAAAQWKGSARHRLRELTPANLNYVVFSDSPLNFDTRFSLSSNILCVQAKHALWKCGVCFSCLRDLTCWSCWFWCCSFATYISCTICPGFTCRLWQVELLFVGMHRWTQTNIIC